jgi:hypothetical protein
MPKSDELRMRAAEYRKMRHGFTDQRAREALEQTAVNLEMEADGLDQTLTQGSGAGATKAGK